MRAARPQWADWSPEVDLLAAIAEMLDRGDRLFVMANTPKGKKAPLWPALRIPRPYKVQRRKLATSPAEVRERFGAEAIRFTPPMKE